MPVGSSSKIHRDDDENNLQGPLPQSGVSLPALVGDVASRANEEIDLPARRSGNTFQTGCLLRATAVASSAIHRKASFDIEQPKAGAAFRGKIYLRDGTCLTNT